MTDTAPERRTTEDTLLSIVVPFLNESAVLDLFMEELLRSLGELGIGFEVICIDNGSSDDTFPRLLAWRTRRPEIRIIKFSRYFGKESAMAAGTDYASGDAVIFMDPDLQDPPGMIRQFLDRWHEGYDLVYATRESNSGDTPMKSFLNGLFYKAFNVIGETNIPFRTGDFRLVDRKIVEVLRQLPERSRFMRGLTSWAGFRSTSIMFERPLRKKGTSKSNWFFLWGYALDAILSSTTRPLRIWSYIGFAISCFSLLAGVALIARTLLLGRDVPGYASMMVVILFMGGFQLLSIGIVAEYVARVYREVQQRPMYIIEQRHGLNAQAGLGLHKER